MQTKHLFLLPALAFLACAGLQAQVRIGDETDPVRGAILDLNSTAKGGLLLSNVSIADLSKIPTGTNLFPGIIAGNNDGDNPDFKGAIVYNTNPDIGMGVYVWTGIQWVPVSTNILYDAEGNDYTIGNFGVAGTWMTQNLRSTQYANGMSLEMGASIYNYDKRYNYPGTGDIPARQAMFEANKEYGLVYSWAAAAGRIDAINDSNGGEDDSSLPGYGRDNPPSPTDYHQGICPDGWHLPSDYEWYKLEDEIAANPDKYSDSTLGDGVGRKMKSQVLNGNSKGSSFSRAKGGFDALLVGYVYASGSAYGYNSFVYFWSSSSDTGGAVDRYLDSGSNVTRIITVKGSLFSVRCKKD